MMQSMMVVGLVFMFGSIAVFLISTIRLCISPTVHLHITPMPEFHINICAMFWAVGAVLSLIGWFL